MPIDAFDLGLQGQAAKRRAAADAALVAAYGDTAGNPEAAASLQRTKQQAQSFPVEQQKAELSVQGAQQDLSDAQAKARNDALLRAYRGTQAAIDAGKDPIPVATHFLQQLKVPPETAAAALEELKRDPASVARGIAALSAPANGADSSRFQFFQDPSGNVYRAGASGEAEAVTAGGQPLQGYQSQQGQQRIDQGEQRLTQARELAQPSFKGQVSAAQKAGEVRGTAAATLPEVETNYAAVKDRITEIRGLPGAAAIFGTPSVAKAIGSGGFGVVPFQFPGSEAANAASRLDGLVSQLRLQAYDVLRGTGPVSNAEGQFAGDAMAALGHAQSYDSFTKELDRLDKFLDRRVTAFKRKAGQAPATETPAANPTDTSGRVEGQNIILKWNPATGRVE